MTEPPKDDAPPSAANEPYQRHEILSRSDSGLNYVREKKSGLVRVLTEDQLSDFSDPQPCEQCGEQFGCEHYNCAGEPLLNDAEIEAEVPSDWLSFAREAGMSREDLTRIRSVVRVEGEYQLAPGSTTDMRMLELMLLLNESR